MWDEHSVQIITLTQGEYHIFVNGFTVESIHVPAEVSNEWKIYVDFDILNKYIENTS